MGVGISWLNTAICHRGRRSQWRLIRRGTGLRRSRLGCASNQKEQGDEESFHGVHYGLKFIRLIVSAALGRLWSKPFGIPLFPGDSLLTKSSSLPASLAHLGV